MDIGITHAHELSRDAALGSLITATDDRPATRGWDRGQDGAGCGLHRGAPTTAPAHSTQAAIFMPIRNAIDSPRVGR
ncbi:hypothetical protein I551_5455 [Mycobacterium ulcerans str. Harvey]|uniref:Uncharacterized protein n=1 Tax=Mycobacterium ulcerans str. Harvey TaxID=1299332 RepID=A0ABN0QTM8_MYCUL|nr:hypothetical protein I551_5455 [Mycobacterium ulcerans str. Harvey]